MSGDLRETETAFYANESDANKYYFVVRKDIPMISFQKLNSRSGLPQSKDQSIAAVTTFLQKNNLLRPGTKEPVVDNNVGESLTPSGERHLNWKTNVISYPQMINGLPVFNAQFNVEVDSNNNIIGLFKNWRDYTPYKESYLKSPKIAFEEFRIKNSQSQQGNPDKIVVSNVSLGYYMQSSEHSENYLQPTYTFDGYYQTGNSTDPFDPVAIPAIQDGPITPAPTDEIPPAYNISNNSSTSVTPEVTALQNISIPETRPIIVIPTKGNLTFGDVTTRTSNGPIPPGTVNVNSTELSNLTRNNGSISRNMTLNISS
jgi:Fungalysin/Thermolysin Propeptide Motif